MVLTKNIINQNTFIQYQYLHLYLFISKNNIELVLLTVSLLISGNAEHSFVKKVPKLNVRKEYICAETHLVF